MRITLVQAEIDLAIVNYINSQVNVKDGMTITVDLSATRGENGFTATIDIVHANSPRITRDMPKVTTATVAAAVVDLKAESADPAQPTPVTLVAEKQEPVAVVQETAPKVEATVAQVNPLVTPAAERPRSLFAGLQKPVNQPS